MSGKGWWQVSGYGVAWESESECVGKNGDVYQVVWKRSLDGL